jgi:hypothetical protein
MNFYEELIQEHFPEVKLPERLRTFFETDEHKKLTGKFVSHLPHYSDWQKVSFMPNDVKILIEDYQDCDLEDEDKRDTFMPVGALGEGEPQFLLVNVKKKDCPIYMWEHENGKFYKLSASLDDFIGDCLHDEEGENEERDDEEE